jgi:hypothetical protein
MRLRRTHQNANPAAATSPAAKPATEPPTAAPTLPLPPLPAGGAAVTDADPGHPVGRGTADGGAVCGGIGDADGGEPCEEDGDAVMEIVGVTDSDGKGGKLGHADAEAAAVAVDASVPPLLSVAVGVDSADPVADAVGDGDGAAVGPPGRQY